MEFKEPTKKKNETYTFHVTYSEDEKRAIILTNVIKMLSARGILDKDPEKHTSYLKEMINSGTDDLIYTLKVLEKTSKEIKGIRDYAVKFNTQKINSLGSAVGIADFLEGNTKAHRIIVTNDISEKGYDEITHFKTDEEGAGPIEIFIEHELMICVIEHELVPEHKVCSPDEVKEVLRAYNCKKSQLDKLNSSDPVARFYNLKQGDVARIISASEISGRRVAYRVVKKTSLFSKK